MRNKNLLALLAAVLLLPVQPGQAFSRNEKVPDWQNPAVFSRNRLPMSATFVTDQQKTLSLNGIWNFKFNPSIESRADGFQNLTYDDGFWKKIPVPGMWEQYGWCDPIYLNVGYPWRGHFSNTPPVVPLEHNYVGQYRRHFDLDASWEGKQVCLCVGSATSNVRVWVNGKEAGYSEDSKLEARFDITRLVRPGRNLIAMEVFRWCDGTYLEDQDFWRLGGIARGVYVYTREKQRIEDLHVVADMYGNLTVRARLTSGIKSMDYQVLDADGRQVDHWVSVSSGKKEKAELGGYFLTDCRQVKTPALWSAETPNLYTLVAAAQNARGNVVESTRIRFGFRSVKVEGSQLLVNGRPILLKGVNRHEMDPYKGYVVSPEDMIRDIRIMKELNINAVRTCHYPNDPLWYRLCDEWGLYVIDEGNIESHGMGYDPVQTLANSAAYHQAHLVRDQRMVCRDFNHPSVIIWSLGNEAGQGVNFMDAYDWVKAYDPSRPVQYSEARHDRNTDIFCPMYHSVGECEHYLQSRPSKPLIQCEYAHAMGNSMGNFKEYWDLIRKYPSYQGGFIWDFVDQALRVETDPARKGGTDHIFAFGGDFNDYDASDGSFNCNGVIAADRTLHPHSAEVRYQYRNILTSLSEGMEYAFSSSQAAAGKELSVQVHNEHFFKDLSDYRMQWTIQAAGQPVMSGVVNDLDAAPQKTVRVGLCSVREVLDAMAARKDRIARRFSATGRNTSADDDCYLLVSYVLKQADGLLDAGTEVAYDQMELNKGADRSFKAGSAATANSAIRYEDLEQTAEFSGCFAYAGTAGDRVAHWKLVFDKANGAICRYEIDGKNYLDEPMMPNFNRAPTENDLGAGLDFKLEPWRSHRFSLASFDVKPVRNRYQVAVQYHPVGDFGYVRMQYVLHPDGSVEVRESLRNAGNLSAAPDLLRFGMTFRMPGICSDLDFYGYGPEENYVDRHSSQLMGHYRQRVEDQYHYGYVRTQESGTKTGLRWFRITNANGTGLEISSGHRFSASAIPFSIHELDASATDPRPRPNPTNGQAGEPRHSLEMKAQAHENDRSSGHTYVCFELLQQGLGGTNSWGLLPLEEYRIPAQEYDFDFVIRPVSN